MQPVGESGLQHIAILYEPPPPFNCHKLQSTNHRQNSRTCDCGRWESLCFTTFEVPLANGRVFLYSNPQQIYQSSEKCMSFYILRKVFLLCFTHVLRRETQSKEIATNQLENEDVMLWNVLPCRSENTVQKEIKLWNEHKGDFRSFVLLLSFIQEVFIFLIKLNMVWFLWCDCYNKVQNAKFLYHLVQSPRQNEIYYGLLFATDSKALATCSAFRLLRETLASFPNSANGKVRLYQKSFSNYIGICEKVFTECIWTRTPHKKHTDTTIRWCLYVPGCIDSTQSHSEG